MKSIEQRLQSRISRRRNVIREVEQDVAMLSQQRRWMREEGGCERSIDYLTMGIRETKQFIAEQADDQKLDKQLKNIVLGFGQTRRHFGLSDL